MADFPMADFPTEEELEVQAKLAKAAKKEKKAARKAKKEAKKAKKAKKVNPYASHPSSSTHAHDV